MGILHPRPTKSGSTTGVQNRTENAGIPKGWKVTSFQNWICKHLQKGNQAIFTGPGQPAHPGQQWPPRGPPPNTGSSHSPCEVSTFQQVPCRPSGPIPLPSPQPILFRKGDITGSSPCIMPVNLPRNFPLGLGGSSQLWSLSLP